MDLPPMDVRCEKCQTEYELDESRLKPGGVTVKCTNCGHMFKIRKRTPTNVSTPSVPSTVVGVAPGTIDTRQKTPSSRAATPNPRADSLLDDAPTARAGLDEGPTTVERQWVIRLENGEQKTCRELATLQQWIVSNVVGRESLISRTGKTWKRLGDIAELAQYFDIADEARKTRSERSTKETGKKPTASTMLGVGHATAAGGTILPDDDEEGGRTTGNFRATGRPITPPPPVPGRTPPMGSGIPPKEPANRKKPLTAPPGPPPKKAPTGPVPIAHAPTSLATPAAPKPTPAPPVGPDSRSTAMWANEPIKATGVPPSGPYVGKLAAIPDEPAFAGRVRVQPSDEASFDTGRVGLVDDDDDMLPRRSGSKAGLIILVMTLLVGIGAAAVVYVFVIKKKDNGTKVATKTDAAVPTPDAASLVVTPMADAQEVKPPSPLELARGELGQNVEPRMRNALETLSKDDPAMQTVRANLETEIAQSLLDRAGLVEKSEADKLRKDEKTIVLDAANAAQRALKNAADDPGANIAMANVLRLQGKPLREMQRYLDAAKASITAPAGDWARDLMLVEARTLARDGKLDDARKAFEAIDSGPNKLETSNDVRARFHLALIALAQNRVPDSKAANDAILTAQPEHPGAKALGAKIESKVSNVDPLPPEDGKGSNAASPKPTPSPSTSPIDTGGGGSYDQLLAKANKMAESNCAKAMELFAKALEQKPNGVEALTGQGYCHIDAKQFASAFSKFRAALMVSPKYEPALWGVAEAYQQQGRREQALEAYKVYLEQFPGSAKAQKQIDRLTAGGAGGSGSTPSPSATPSPSPSPTEAPQPTKEPTPTGVPVGSGSG